MSAHIRTSKRAVAVPRQLPPAYESRLAITSWKTEFTTASDDTWGEAFINSIVLTAAMHNIRCVSAILGNYSLLKDI